MPFFNFYDPARKASLGVYEADTGAAAAELMAKDAGFDSAEHMRAATGNDPDLIVSEVPAPAPLKRGAIVTLKPRFREPGDDGRTWLVNADETGAGLRLAPLGAPATLVHIVTRAMVDQIAPAPEDRRAAFTLMRKAAGTQEEVADYLEVSVRSVKGWESGKTRVNPTAYRLLAQGGIAKAKQ